MKYTFTCGPEMGSYGADKDKIIDEIVNRCNDLEAYDTITVYDFGENGDLLLSIEKDPDYDSSVDEDAYNIVRIYTSQLQADGMVKSVDDTEDTYVTDGSLHKELNRIWEYRNFALCA